MAKEYSFEIFAHPSIYKSKERKLPIYFSEPEKGMDKDTGLLLLIAGFGGHSNSNVYKKMRNLFADRYNLVTVQCDYFGWEFMQNHDSIEEIQKLSINSSDYFFVNCEKLEEMISEQDFYSLMSEYSLEKLIEIYSKYHRAIPCNRRFVEVKSNFNDMGLMQAIDNLNAMGVLYQIIKENGYFVNKNKIIAYGYSHGAYLSYLCNAFAPGLFSMIIDNSAWNFPVYLNEDRNLISKFSNIIFSIDFEYVARWMGFDRELLSLSLLYRKFENKCKIICYHGSDDLLVAIDEKEKFIRGIDNVFFHKISVDDVDGEIFRSTGHGLDADFIKLFDLSMEKYGGFVSDQNDIILQNVSYKTKKHQYDFRYENNIPFLTIK